MAKKKSRAKRRVASRRKTSVAKPMPANCCNWHAGMFWTKLSAMAFILFLITVWPALHKLVMSIHWGWFLGATIFFMLLSMNSHPKR